MVKKFTIPFASQGDANDIPDALQVDGKVSFTQGFGYDYERPYDDPQAKDIAREDMNGLFKAITSAVGELQTLGASEWSSAISYPKGAIVYYEKDLYISQVDDNQSEPPQNWVSITSIANDSLKKAANLSDLTNKTTARSNLGLGSSATLNKTDTLGTSTSLVATQKLVNDTKINLESSKQDKLTFVGDGPEVMKTGAGGFVNKRLNFIRFNLDDDIFPCTQSGIVDDHSKYGYPSSLFFGYKSSDTDKNISGLHVPTTNNNIFITKKVPEDLGGFVKYDLYHNKNTTVDKSGFLRASGSANALTDQNNQQIGVGQTWVDVTSQRVSGATYTNNTGKPIMINITPDWYDSTNDAYFLYVDNVDVARFYMNQQYNNVTTMSAIVPPGSSYKAIFPRDLTGWIELR